MGRAVNRGARRRWTATRRGVDGRRLLPTRRTGERASALSEEIERIEAQHRELGALLREREAYLADVETLVARMEERCRQWRER
jgi:hypothetical protein